MINLKGPSRLGGTNLKWQYFPADYKLQKILSVGLNISPVTAQLLINRGIKTVSEARQFIQPQLAGLSDPLKMAGMAKACRRIEQAFQKNEKIVIYGDYDVDGISGTVLLVRLFELMGHPVAFYIPHRLEDGYSLNRKAIDRFVNDKVNLVITVDCGSSSINEAAYAQTKGVDIIITDHHRCGALLPEVVALINPMMANAGEPSGPRSEPVIPLSGVAVAFKLAWALTQNFSDAKKSSREFHDFLMDAISLVTLGTIADVVPLIGENRILVSYGLEALRQTGIPGLKALMAQCNLGAAPLSTSDISFRIAPRLNAGGRLGSAEAGVELFLSRSEERIKEIVEQLEVANRKRQKIQKDIIGEVISDIQAEYDLDQEPVIVLAGENWHPGVLGVVAAKIAEEFYRPTILISLMGEKCRGSGRSIPSFHLYNALNDCREILTSFGGHAYAAGLEIAREQIPRLREILNDRAQQQLPKESLIPILKIDAEIPFAVIDRSLLTEIFHLAPFGEANREPIFSSGGAEIVGVPKLMGSKNNEMAFFVRQNNRTFRAVGFKMGSRIDELVDSEHRNVNIVYTLKLNRWQGEESIELILKDFKVDKT
ncbi:MAG: single-stranded-DNA-specific exonuclease RecJ [Planctomycetota bacterium]